MRLPPQNGQTGLRLLRVNARGEPQSGGQVSEPYSYPAVGGGLASISTPSSNGVELDFQTRNTDWSQVGAGGSTILTCNPVYCDGRSRLMVEFGAGFVNVGNDITFIMVLDGVDVGNNGSIQYPDISKPHYFVNYFIPTKGQRTFAVRATVGASTATVYGVGSGRGIIYLRVSGMGR